MTKGFVCVSIVITTFNDEDVIGEALSAVLANIKHCSIPAELIVVDGGSSDQTLLKIQEFLASHASDFKNVKVMVHPENLGVSKARNDGISISSCDLVLILDSDVVLPPQALCTMIEYLIRSEKLGRSVAVRPLLDTAFPLYFRIVHGRIHKFSYGASEALLMRTAIAQKIKYNERLGPPFSSDEDLEYAARLIANGVEIHTLGYIVAHHNKPRTSLYIAVSTSLSERLRKAFRILKSYFHEYTQRGFAGFFKALNSAGIRYISSWIISAAILPVFTLSIVYPKLIVAASILIVFYLILVLRAELRLQPSLRLRDAPIALAYIVLTLVNRALRMYSLAFFHIKQLRKYLWSRKDAEQWSR